jgi:hypothetical protein
MCEYLSVMKHYIENNELHINSEASDKWSGKTKAVKTAWHRTSPNSGEMVLECGEITTPTGKKDRLMIRLADKPKLKAMVARWEELNMGLDQPAKDAIAEAKRTGKEVVIETWTETRRYRDCGQSVEGMCEIERVARPNGTLAQNIKPCH